MRIDSTGKLLLGLATGVVFGGLLQRGRVSRYNVIMDQLLLKDWSVVKMMGSAVVVGAIGVHSLVRAGKAKLDIKPLQLGGIVGGGVAFGTGLALVGYCPGTTLAALGEGKPDAVAGTLGMLAGAALFIRSYPSLKPVIEVGDQGKVTLHRMGGSRWPWVGAIASAVTWASLHTPPPKARLRFMRRLPA